MAVAKKEIGKYKVIGKISQGGMGAIYKATHPTLNKTIIIKQLIIKKNASIIERFKREARIMMDFRDERIVQVYDHFKEGSSYFIAMEYIDGMSLEQLIEDKRYLSNEAAIIIFSEICKGLKYAHDKGVIHRDIKPANILISKDGAIKLTDFGIAKAEEDSGTALTKAGSTLGTPAFISPEQISDTKNVEITTDIYSMGVMLYNMVTGKLPFPSDISPQTIVKIQKGIYQAPKKVNPKIKSCLVRVIKKSMAVDKNKRLKSMDKILKILKPHTLRTENKEEIDAVIKDYIGGKDIVLNAKGSKTHGGRKSLLLKLAAIPVVLLAGIFFLYKIGTFHTVFMPKKYGALKVTIEAKKDFNIDLERDIDALLSVRNEKGEYQVLSDKKIRFRKIKSDNDVVLYESRKLFLKTDNYKLNVNVLNDRHAKFIFINPLFYRQKLFDNKVNAVKITYKKLPSLPVTARFMFFDITNNNPLDKTEIFILFNKKWQKWDTFKKLNLKTFKSGKTYHFLFQRTGYLAEKKKIYIAPRQTVLNISEKLTPKPAVLTLNSNNSSLKILLNNSVHYFQGSRDRKILRVQPSVFKVMINNILYTVTGKEKGKYKDVDRKRFKKMSLTLQPGEYILTVKKGLFLTITEKITLTRDKKMSIYINYNKEKKLLEIKK